MKPPKKPAPRNAKSAATSFPALVAAIREVHEQCATQAVKAVNISLTFRNWLIGAHIHHYELQGADRAAYGDKLQDFLLELGHGFCFEARQKRLLIGGEHFFVDLVFYHRILK